MTLLWVRRWFSAFTQTHSLNVLNYAGNRVWNGCPSGEGVQSFGASLQLRGSLI